MNCADHSDLHKPPVFLMEKHDSAYLVWRDASVKNRILLHIDAHHDMWWIEEPELITIANFICAALREGMVREMVWVVPDRTWKRPDSRKALQRFLREFVKTYPESRSTFQERDRRYSAVIMGKPLTICPMDSMPAFREPVLLDIDVDYLVVPYVPPGGRDPHEALPWCWPEQLISRLEERGIRSDFATVSYSVEGGYTTLKWKYLGDELSARLRGADPEGAILQGMNLMRIGATAAAEGDFQTAERNYHEAAEHLPNDAAANYHLAQLYLEMGRVADAQRFYERARSTDRTYSIAVDTAGELYQSAKDFTKVEQPIRMALKLDPNDAYAHFGLGKIAAGRKRWVDAERSLRQCLDLDRRMVDAYRTLGYVLGKQHRNDEAIQAYEASLKAALSGHKAMAVPITTAPPGRHGVADPHHCRVHAELGRLYGIKGETAKAITAYRISIAGLYDPPAVRARLACLYTREHRWNAAIAEFSRAGKSGVEELGRVTARSGRNFVRFLNRVTARLAGRPVYR